MTSSSPAGSPANRPGDEAIDQAVRDYFASEAPSASDPSLAQQGYEPIDVMADVLLAVVEEARVDPRTAFGVSKQELVRRARNRVGTVRKRARSRPPSISLGPSEESGPIGLLASRREPSPEARLLREEVRRTVEAALNGLSSKQAELLRLVYLQGIGGPTQAAHQMRIPVGTATAEIKRGLDRLRRLPALALVS